MVRDALVAFQIPVVERKRVVAQVNERGLTARLLDTNRGEPRQALVVGCCSRAAGEDHDLIVWFVHLSPLASNR